MFAEWMKDISLKVTGKDIEAYKKRNKRKIKRFRKRCKFIDQEFNKLITMRKEEISIPFNKLPILKNQGYLGKKIWLMQYVYGIRLNASIDKEKQCIVVKIER